MTGPRDYRNRPCTSCGKATKRAHPKCLDCYLIGHPAIYGPDHALTGGDWQPDGNGVQRWVKRGAA